MNQNLLVKTLVVLNVLLLAGLVVLYIMFFNAKGTPSAKSGKGGKLNDTLQTTLPIAYINLDSLLLQYQMSIDLNEDLLTEHAKSKANLERQVKQFEKDYEAFMEKARLGTFLSQSSMDAQQNALVQQQQKLQDLDAQLTQELLDKQTAMNKQLYDSVLNYIHEFNNDKYSMILGNSSGAIVLYGEEGMDITRDVVANLNERYLKSKK
ncbi:MAG TPA: OmpH family outer membrane protein [Bacteroidales bacterium]|nr:OmpH family outer membrane protein [Bacteroidales bacterium]